uniref:Transposase and inactivated derivative n=1 Tax=uncultured bacterium FLS12 TaxID=651659 RepID=C5HLB3_9BACT|nr:transposase and inactivated derivative [uncultured bacterium FLS12]
MGRGEHETELSIARRRGMSNSYWIGVDLGKQSLDAAVAEVGGPTAQWMRLPAASFETNPGLAPLVRWAQAQLDGGAVAGVCIESTGRLGWRFMETLGDALGPVSMVNPARTKAFGDSLGQRDKTDRADACVLAFYGATMQPPPTAKPSAVLQELRECNRLFSALSTDKQAYQKRLLDGPASALVRKELQQTIRALERRMAKMQEHMDNLIAADRSMKDDVERITSIKGVGPRTALVLLAELGDLRRFSRNELASYVGLYPRCHESGSSVRKRPRMVKRGGAAIRKALYLCAMSARVHNPQMRRLFQRLTQNGKAPMAALGAIMRKLLLLARSLLVNNTVYDPCHT